MHHRIILLIAILCIASPASAPAVWALGGDSLIQIIQESLSSIVGIEAENAQLFKTRDIGIRDAATGRLAIARGLKSSKYLRSGAGVIIDSSGLIATNAHLVLHPGRIAVTLHDNSKYEAKVVWVAPEEDLAFLRIPPLSPYQPLAFSNSDDARIGTPVYAIGNSEFIKGTIAQGKITGIGNKASRKDANDPLVDILQTNFSTYRGDSGGPLLDSAGRLLGLIVAAETKAPHATFAIPSNKIKHYYLTYTQKTSP